MTRHFRFILAVALLAATGSAAQADSYVKFYGDNHNYSGAFSSGAVYNTLLGTGTATCGAGSTNCTVTSGDIISGTVVFTGTGITASSAGSVWWDLAPPYGGLGVGTGSGSANSQDDQLNQENTAEILHLHFNTQVTLTGVATLFDEANHAPFGSGYTAGTIANSNKDFLICATAGVSCTPGTKITFLSANTNGMSQTGTDFYFEGDTAAGVDFYVGGLIYHGVPGPLAGAGLPGLILVGGALVWWRRRKHEPTNARVAA